MCRRTNDEFGRQHNLARFMLGFAFDTLDQELHPELTELIGRLGRDGEERIDCARWSEVVEADDRHVAWHLQATPGVRIG